MSSWIVLPLVSIAYALTLTFLAGRITPLSPQGQTLQRKVFHVGIFTGAVPAQLHFGFWGVVLYGVTVSGLVLLSWVRGPRSSLFGILDRSGKGGGRPEILPPLLSTALGGTLAVLLVGHFAAVGYLACGWGDAAGEIVGVRWGRRFLPSLPPGSRTSSKTLEGSLAVLLLAGLGSWAALALLGFEPLPAMGAGLVSGAVAAVAEALSWEGTDNLWVQLLPAVAAWWLLG
jgi:hypothetical protein